MSCHGCASKFGVFTKEKGCPGCGFSFCKKCLRFKAIIPSVGTEQNVCKNCYENTSSEKKNSGEEFRPPPDVFLRRLENLENPARPPITVYHHDSRMEELKTGLTAEDREIAERLEKLKDERKRQREVPTEEDIVRRLAALKGQNPEKAVEVTLKKKEVFNLPDTRSDEEKTNDLIKQLLEEQILAVKHISPEELIAKRLARLRDEDPTAPSHSEKSKDLNVEALAGQPNENSEKGTDDDVRELMKLAKSELDAAEKELKPGLAKHKQRKDVDEKSEESDNEAVDQVVRRAMDEAALGDDDEDELESKTDSDIPDTEELPWCTICNEDAIIRCLSCDGDLFCSKCFSEFHDDNDMKQHKTIPFESRKKS